MLRDDQVRRYSRHILVPDVGGTGQDRLLAAAIALDVRDPAARQAALYLAAAGLGTLVFDDPALASRLTAQNPDVRICGVQCTPHPPGAVQCTPQGLGLEECPGSGHADALVRGGVAACRLIHEIVRG